MTKTICRLLTLFFILSISQLFSQQENVEQLIESAGEISEDHELTELLKELENHPLNVNEVSAEELTILPWISDVLARNVVEYRKKHGKFTNLHQLEQVEGFDAALVTVLYSYLTVAELSPVERSLIHQTRIQRKIEQSRGLKDGTYYPSPDKIYNRFDFRYGQNLRAGLLLEKDAGEKPINDFQSFFVEYARNKNLKFVVGNYLLEFAQGLVFWNPYARYKGINPIYSAKKHARNIKPYTLVDENAPLRGLAAYFCSKFYQMTIFYSNQFLDATTMQDEISNLYKTGLHRTASERLKKDVLKENLFGLRLRFLLNDNFSIGTTGYVSKFNKKFSIRDIERYRFRFTGDKNSVIGLDANYIFADFNFFAEVARSRNSALAAIAGLLFNTRYVDFAILYRNYPPDFHSFHGSGFGEHGDNLENETGLFLSARFRILKNLILSFYHDQFYFPWRTYSLPEPARGNDFLLALEYKPLRKMHIYFHIKRRSKPRSVTIYDEHNFEKKWVINNEKTNIRAQFEYKLAKSLTLRFRWEKVWSEYPDNHYIQLRSQRKSTGSLLYQDISYRASPKIILSARLTFFDTENYESRVYQFERDLPGILTNQMLYGQGSRWYLLINYHASSFINFAAKISSTNYYYKSSIGSGADAIAGDHLTNVAFLVQTQW